MTEVRPRTGQVPKRRVIAYDLEWYPESYKLRMAGAYDGERYRWYTSIGEFCRNELTRKNDGAWFYAHFGGATDLLFFFEWWAEHGTDFEVSASFAGSAANIVRVKRAGLEWCFVDSTFLMRTSLAKIGEWIGNKKGSCAFDAPLPELVEYNEQDCRVLYQAIRAFEAVVHTQGGALCMTAASTALDIFLRRYLRAPITTTPFSNEFCRRGYQASRVEPLRERCERANVYDINSSFPYSMLSELPGSFLRASHGSRVKKRRGALGVYEAKVAVEPDVYFPPLPYRSTDGRLFFPVGSWTGVFTDADLDLLEESGGRILSIGTGYEFAPNTDMAGFAESIYALRMGGSGFESEVWKIVLNSLYGKFAESNDKEGIVINPRETDHRDRADMLAPGIWIENTTVDVKHQHVPFSMWITSLARGTLYRYAKQALDQGGQVYYLDTDSVFTNAVLPTGKGLGSLKLEGEIAAGVMVLPKLYAKQSLSGEWTIKAKGFQGGRVPGTEGAQVKTEKRKLTYDDFVALTEGRELEIDRMMRARELMRDHMRLGTALSPRGKTIQKGLRFRARPKRAPWGNNNTRPWAVSEIEARDK